MLRGDCLRLFDPEDENDFGRLTLREVFEQWYLPQVLSDPLERQRPVSESTITLYRNALDWWERSTRNPLSCEINDEDAKAFLAGLATLTYSRSKFGGQRLLSASSRAKHVASVRAILNRLIDSDRGTSLQILEKRVRLKKPMVSYLPKATPPLSWLLDLCTRLRASEQLRSLALPAPPGSQPVLWWRAFLATLYAHGWRVQTTLGLKKSFIAAEEIPRLRVPGEASIKTYKAGIRPIPAWLAKLWEAANVSGPFILGQPAARRQLYDSFQTIQEVSGIAGRYSFQALRRMHSRECGAVGLDVATSISSAALQHSDSSVTKSHYADLLEAAILRLPPVP